VGQYEATKKKSPETTNNRPDRGSTRLPAQGSSGGSRVSPWLRFSPPGSGQLRGRAGQLRGASSVTAAPVPTSRLRVAPGPARVPWAPALASRRRAAPGAPRVTAAPGRMKTVEPSSSENRAQDEEKKLAPDAGQLQGHRVSPWL
jgi:hypothetical protein